VCAHLAKCAARGSFWAAWLLSCLVVLMAREARAEIATEARVVPALEQKSFEAGKAHYALALESQASYGQKRAAWARFLEQVVQEGAQDLDLSLGLSGRQEVRAEAISNAMLIEWARSSWVIVPIIAEANAGEFEITLVVIPPGSQVILSKSETLRGQELEVRVMVMLRDLVAAGRRQLGGSSLMPPSAAVPATATSASPIGATPTRSPGRAILSATGAALGGYTGFALQRASGSSDLRLTYPLAALGAGVGLGTAMVVADEWDISAAEAWYLAAGTLWPNVAAEFLADGYRARVKDRYLWGLLGSGAGLVLGTAAVSHSSIEDGGAVILHSASAFGFGVGSLGEFIVEGRSDFVPQRGIGFGTASGAVLGGALATQLKLSASRVLMVDVGVALGGLGGAAALSPLLIVDRKGSSVRNRIWLSGIVAGMATGGVVAYLTTEDSKKSTSAQASFAPYVGPGLEAHGPTTWELGVQGLW